MSDASINPGGSNFKISPEDKQFPSPHSYQPDASHPPFIPRLFPVSSPCFCPYHPKVQFPFSTRKSESFPLQISNITSILYSRPSHGSWVHSDWKSSGHKGLQALKDPSLLLPTFYLHLEDLPHPPMCGWRRSCSLEFPICANCHFCKV